MESRMKCTRCGTDTVTGPLRHSGDERLCGLCWHDQTGEGAVVACVECGTRWHVDLGDGPGEELVRESYCFSCGFWSLYEAMKDDPKVVRIEGHHFLIGEPSCGMKGSYGRRFVVEFFDGRRVETDCLWSQGRIPPRFRDRMPDNARFA